MSETKQKPTPGPWTFGTPITEPGPTHGDILIRGEEGYGIARVLAGDAILNGPSSESNPEGDYAEAVAERQANAAFIVQACNSHAQLVEALKHLLEDAIATGMDSGDLTGGLIEARAALRAAEGKE